MDTEATESSCCSKNCTEDASSLFNCKICWQLAEDPVVTQCGHLFCWFCLCSWLQSFSKCKECPICRAIIEEDKLVPLYGTESERKEAKDLDPNSEKSIPNRPIAPRPQTATHPNNEEDYFAEDYFSEDWDEDEDDFSEDIDHEDLNSSMSFKSKLVNNVGFIILGILICLFLIISATFLCSFVRNKSDGNSTEEYLPAISTSCNPNPLYYEIRGPSWKEAAFLPHGALVVESFGKLRGVWDPSMVPQVRFLGHRFCESRQRLKETQYNILGISNATTGLVSVDGSLLTQVIEALIDEALMYVII